MLRGWAAAEAWAYPRSAQAPGGAQVLATRFFKGAAGVMAVTTRPGELLVYRSHDAYWRKRPGPPLCPKVAASPPPWP